MAIFLERIVDLVSRLTGLEREEVTRLIEIPPDPALGDYAFPCFQLARKEKESPPDLASRLAREVGHQEFLEKAVAKGPYLNFTVSKKLRARQVLGEICEMRAGYGTSERGKGKTVVIDYSSPNIAKPFAIALLRTTIIGAAIYNIYKSLGYRCVGINHLGDWGTQFGMVLAAFGLWGDAKALEEKPIEHLCELYVRYNREAEENPDLAEKARSLFRKLESGDEEARSLWEKFRDLSIKEFEKTYRRLGIKFDIYRGESFYREKAREIITDLKQKDILKESEGALIVNLEGEGLGTVLLQKRDGSSLYPTRDLAAAVHRSREFSFDRLIYVVGAPQKLHFQQLFRILEMAGYDWFSRCVHVDFGHILGMRTREGNLILLDEVLDEAHNRALVKMKESQRRPEDLGDEARVAEAVGMGAVIFQDLSTRRGKDISFDWDKMLNFEGDSGPYLQYAHARLAGIIRKCGYQVKPEVDVSLLVEPEAEALVRELERYPGVVVRAAESYEPSMISTYLIDLAQALSSAYNVLRVKGRERKLAEARLLLLSGVKHVLANGMHLLGIPVLEKM